MLKRTTISCLACLLLLPPISAFAQAHAVPVAGNALSGDIFESTLSTRAFSSEPFEDVLAEMDELRVPDLAGLTGQVGIRIDMSIEIIGGYVSWGDTDGYSKAYLDEPGYLTLNDMRLNDGNTDPVGPVEIIGLTIDAGTEDDESYLLIGMPSIHGAVSFAEVKIGTGVNQGPSLGSIEVGDFHVGSSMIKIKPHTSE